MSIFDILSLLGGLAMFLYGMRLMGDSLKGNSSGTLKIAMEHVTDNPVKAFVLGVLVTALIQSSTATIVITSGLVGAGILTLHQSLGIIIGANVGTTVTGQIIRLLDLNSASGGGMTWLRFFQPSTLSSIALIIGMAIIMSGRVRDSRSTGGIAIGFGILFSGLLNMTGAVNTLSESGILEQMFARLGESPLLGYLTGAGVAFVLQSSSATVGILQAFSASGMLTFRAVYAVIAGIYLGDCVTTAIVCSIGAEAEQKRVGIVNILFNLSETALVLIGVTAAHHAGLLDGLWNQTINSGIIANTNTVFNLTSAVCLFPMIGVYEKLSHWIIRDGTPGTPDESAGKYKPRIDALNPAFFDTPAFALNSCYELLLTIFQSSRNNMERAFGLLENYDESVYEKVCADEDEIDRMTDRLSRYTMELLPHLQNELHVTILDQYYKIITDFERLGDHAENIADNAKSLAKHQASYSPQAVEELHVLEDAIREILNFTETSFRRRSLEAAREIEPRVQVTEKMIALLRRHHMERMRNGTCKTYADASFTGLLIELKRFAGVCSNVGISTVVRINPELADHEHGYFQRLRSGEDESYNKSFQSAYEKYFSRLEQSDPQPVPGTD